MMVHSDTLKVLLPQLRDLGIAKKWAGSDDPVKGLRLECRSLLGAAEPELVSYLQSNPVICESLGSVLAQLAFSAGAHWQDTAPILQPLARRGWHIARWVPTFLLIDGPLGRLLRASESPVAKVLKSEYKTYPLLASARDAFQGDLFRRVRNAFGHWSFVWRDGDTIDLINFDTGVCDGTLTLLQAEALHLVSFSVVEAFDVEVLRPLGGRVSSKANKPMQPDRPHRSPDRRNR